MEGFDPTKTISINEVNLARVKFVKILTQHGSVTKYWVDLPHPLPPAKPTPSLPTRRTRRKRTTKSRTTARYRPRQANQPTLSNNQLQSLEKRIIEATTAACVAAKAAQAATKAAQSVIKPPVVQPPVYQPPVVQPPVTNPPVVQPPVTNPPVVQSTPNKKRKRKRKRRRKRSRRKRSSSSSEPESSSCTSSSTPVKESPRSRRYRRRLTDKVVKRAFHMCMNYSPIIATPPMLMNRSSPMGRGLGQYMNYPFKYM